MELPTRTLESLDWPAVVEALAACARTPMGARACRSLAPLDEAAAVRGAHDAVDELALLEEEQGEAVPVGAVGDVGPLVRRAGKGEVLDDAELREAGGALVALQDLHEAVQERGEDAPTLAAIASGISVDGELRDELARAFDRTGQLSASAYPVLGELRERISELHRSIRSTLDELLRSEDYADILQEDYVTIRSDRYVLPVKSHAKRWDLGVVHGTSGSGQTAYVEPHRVVELNNRLRVAEGQLAAEERRIRAQLSQWIGSRQEELLQSLVSVAELDLACARLGLARALDMTRPDVGEQGVVRLRRARHPVLLLRGVEVVPNDLALTAESPALVLSGPNTGGKTVALKTIGLCALLVRAGCFVPAAEGSRCDLFRAVLADIGDAQTVQGDLSSFSAQVVALREMLRRAGPGTLLLLDELCTGTDPSQGAALARAFLEAALDRGPSLVVTTHYAQLKGMGAADPRFQVAAVEYADGRPTYKVVTGATGESHAFAIATGLGLSDAVISRARDLMSDAEIELSEALDALDRQRQEAEAAEREARARREAMEAREAEVARREQQLKERSKELEQRHAQRFIDRLARAERVLSEVVADLQRAPSHEGVRDARATLEALRDVVPDEPEQEAEAPALSPGDRVRLPKLGGQTGTVQSVGDKGVQVRAGKVTLRVRPEECEPIAAPKPRAPAPKPRRKKRRPRSSEAVDLDQALRLPGNTLDLRGKRVDEGIDEVERFLDQAAMSGQDYVFVLHGHGTGAMKQAVRRYLPGSRYVARAAPANEDQGGDAFTVVALR